MNVQLAFMIFAFVLLAAPLAEGQQAAKGNRIAMVNSGPLSRALLLRA